MSKKFQLKQIDPDPVFSSVLVARFINRIMKGGKKNIARRIVYGAFEIISKETKKEPIDVFEKAILVVGPTVAVKARRIGGATYQVPIEVEDKRRISLAMRWIVGAARAKSGATMEVRLAEELIDASKNEGEAIKKKINVERMAAANRAFAHLGKKRKKTT